jgi:hypothetical protein
MILSIRLKKLNAEIITAVEVITKKTPAAVMEIFKIILANDIGCTEITH